MDFKVMPLRQAWEEFRFGNGAPSLDDMVQRIGKFGSVKRLLTTESLIGCTILDGIRWLEEPLEAASLGIEWAPSIVRGKSLSEAQEHAILDQEPDYRDPRERHNMLAVLNRAYREAPSRRKEVVSKRIERNPLIVAELKRRHPRLCQLCGTEFFLKKGRRARYSEVHHVKELSKGGLDVTDNCVVLCATCHRKMHYGDVVVVDEPNSILVREGKTETQMVRNRID